MRRRAAARRPAAPCARTAKAAAHPCRACKAPNPPLHAPPAPRSQALEDRANASVKRELDAALKELKALPKAALTQPPANGNGNGSGASTDGGESERPDGPAALLARCRELAMQIEVPPALREALAAKMAAAGIPAPDSEARWAAALEALKGVWASKYNDRAFYSLRKCGIDANDVRMAVCVMRVVPARYAFVIHTKNPQTNDASEVGGRGWRAAAPLLLRPGSHPSRTLLLTHAHARPNAPRSLLKWSRAWARAS